MATIELEAGGRGLRRPLGIRALLARAWQRYVARMSRSDQIARLQAKSDDELARMGLRRDRIVHYVFRDRLWV